MAERCIGPYCSVRFRDKSKSNSKCARNVLLPEYRWLTESLQLDRVNTSNLKETKICYKCFKKYDRRRGSKLNKTDDFEAIDVDENNDCIEKDVTMDITARDDSPACNEELDTVINDSDAYYDAAHVDDDGEDMKLTLKSVSASNQLPLLTIH